MAITIIVGYVGSGKTLYQTYLVNKFCRENPNTPVFTNYEIKIDKKKKCYIFYYVRIPEKFYNFFTKKFPKLARKLKFAEIKLNNEVIKFEKLEDIYNVNKAVIVIDEMATLFSNRDWKNTPAWFLTKLAMHRHEGLDLIGTAQRYDGVDNVIRELANIILWIQKLNKNIFLLKRVSYHPILPEIKIKFQDLFFATKKDFKRYNSWSNEAYRVDTGNTKNYKPNFE